MAVSKKADDKGCGVSKTTAKCAPAKGCGKNISQEMLNTMITERAYYIWEERGRPEGQDMDIWLQAEREILSRVK